MWVAFDPVAKEVALHFDRTGPISIPTEFAQFKIYADGGIVSVFAKDDMIEIAILPVEEDGGVPLLRSFQPNRWLIEFLPPGREMA